LSNLRCLILGLLYIVNQIDRINLPVAVVAGLSKDIKLVGNQYSIIVLAFFPTYVIVQPVATAICRFTGPRPFMTFIVFVWGCMIIGLGLSKNWQSLVAFRALLGALEAGYTPASLFLLSMWYVRKEVAKRNAVFYLMGNGASGFGGIIAYGLMQTGNHGLGGLKRWQWIFIWVCSSLPASSSC
jgi:MFS family permease